MTSKAALDALMSNTVSYLSACCEIELGRKVDDYEAACLSRVVQKTFESAGINASVAEMVAMLESMEDQRPHDLAAAILKQCDTQSRQATAESKEATRIDFLKVLGPKMFKLVVNSLELMRQHRAEAHAIYTDAVRDDKTPQALLNAAAFGVNDVQEVLDRINAKPY